MGNVILLIPYSSLFFPLDIEVDFECLCSSSHRQGAAFFMFPVKDLKPLLIISHMDLEKLATNEVIFVGKKNPHIH